MMISPKRIALMLASTALVTACSLPSPNTLDRTDVRNFAADDAFANSLPSTDPADIVSGRANYKGHIRSGAIVEGKDDFIVVGLLDLDVDIANSGRPGSGPISGTITDLNLFDEGNDGFDDQGLDGTLTITGRATDGEIAATAGGQIGAVVADFVDRPKSEWLLNMNGDFRDDVTPGDVIAGTVTGGTTATSSNAYSVRLSGDGKFFGELD